MAHAFEKLPNVLDALVILRVGQLAFTVLETVAILPIVNEATSLESSTSMQLIVQPGALVWSTIFPCQQPIALTHAIYEVSSVFLQVLNFVLRVS